MDPNAIMEEEIQVLDWGSSLVVPSIQEIVRKDSLNVPERYIQQHNDRPQSTIFCELEFQIPVINFSLLVNGDEHELKRLDLACREWGFFQMTDHGVSAEVLQKLKASVDAFFDLPWEKKKKYAMADNDIQGYGQVFVVSEHQKLDWCDMIFLMTLPQKHKQLQYWPLVIPGFRESVEGYAAEVCRLNEVILSKLSLLMGLEKDGLKTIHGEMKQGIRMNYYPPCPKPELVVGISPHSDQNSLTYLIQKDDISGLQIRHNGGWVPVKPIPNAIVVNVGDALEAWSNGLYKSIEHRAVINETAARISMATFIGPDDEVEIGPVETMMENVNMARMYKSIKFADYMKLALAKKMDGKANIELLKL